MFLRNFFLLLTLNILIFSLPISSANSQFQTHHVSAKRPPPPKRIPPNKVKPGGGLDFGQQACTEQQESLIALIPVDNPVLTTQSHPSFLFYIPDESSAISHGEFDLFTADEKTRIYSTTITFQTETPGIIKVDLPVSPQYALKTAKPYHWYFKIYCSNQLNSSLLLDVDGWIERVALTSTRASQIKAASPDIWYDAIALAATNLMTKPQNTVVQARWLELLKYINQEHLFNVGIQSITTTTTNLSEQN